MISLKDERTGNTKGHWEFSEEEIVKIQNRMNDLWNTEPSDIDEYVGAANRLIGVLDAYMTFEHYKGGKF